MRLLRKEGSSWLRLLSEIVGLPKKGEREGLKTSPSHPYIYIFYRRAGLGRWEGGTQHFPNCQTVRKHSQTPHPAVTHLPSGRDGDLIRYYKTSQNFSLIFFFPSLTAWVFISLNLWKLYSHLLLWLHWVRTLQCFSLPEKSVVLKKSVTPKWADKPLKRLMVLVKALRA